MKHSTKLSAVVVAGIAAISLFAAPMAMAAPGDLSEAESAALVFNRDEERMARDLYQAFSNQYDGARPFSRIVNAEQWHFDQMGVLLTNYGIADPAANAVPGVYADPDLQALYDAWHAQGMISLQEAYQVGVELETQDIADLEESIAVTTAEDVRLTLERLKAGSENHLAAFTRAANGTFAGGQGTRSPRGGQNFGGDNGTCDGTCDRTQQGAGGQGQQAQQGGQGQQGMAAGQGAGQQGAGQGAGPGAQRGAGQGAGQGGAQQRPADGTGPGAGTGDCPHVS